MQTTTNSPVNFYLKAALKAYLASKAPGYAFLIKAPWGTGKTFFINVELPPTRTVDNFWNRQNTQKILHLSLSGCGDMPEFRKRLFKALVPSTSGKKRSKMLSESLNSVKHFTKKFGIDPTTFAAQTSVCYVIDDLERCKMPLDETMGAINELVEQLQCHVIILANVGEILKNDKDRWGEIQEKVIGETFEYQCKVEVAFKAFCKRLQSTLAKDLFQSEAGKGRLLYAFSVFGNGNLRALSRGMKLLDTVCAGLPKEYFLDYQKQLITFLGYLFALYCGVHTGAISREDLNKFKDTGYGRIYSIAHESEDFKSFLKKLGNSAYRTYLSGPIFYEILSDGFVDTVKIKEALLQMSDFRPTAKKESWQLVWRGSELEDELFQYAVKEMEEKWTKREYREAGKILHVAMLRLWLADMGELNLTEKQLDSELDEYLADASNNDFFELKTPEEQFSREIYESYGLGVMGESQDTQFFGKPGTTFFSDVVKRIDNVRKATKESQYDDWAKKLIKQLIDNPDKFEVQAAYAGGVGGVFLHTPIFRKQHAKQIFTSLIKLPNQQQRDIILALQNRYGFDVLTNKLKDEAVFVSELIKLMENHSRKLSGMKQYRYIQMVEWLKQVLPNKDVVTELDN